MGTITNKAYFRRCLRKGDSLSIGYACISLGVEGTKLKGCTLKNATQDNLRNITVHNLLALEKMVDYNICRGITMFRISSNVIPFASHPVNSQEWWKEHSDIFIRMGSKIRKAGMRISLHPGQYTVLNSQSDEVVERAKKELGYHALFLDTLSVDPSNKIILHIGGIYGDKETAAKRFEMNYSSLTDAVRRRLVIENDERCFSIDQVLKVGIYLGIPVVFDNLHNSLNPSKEDITELEWIKHCSKTWREHDGNQKIHYSQQGINGKPGAHSASISIRPFLDFYNHVKGMKVDIMLEVKDKNLSALKCIYSVEKSTQIKGIQEEWARYKYLVLERSHTCYLELREMFKNQKSLSAVTFYEKIEEALSVIPTKGSVINASQHVWGYFKDFALVSEKARFNVILNNYKIGKITVSSLKSFLLKMAFKYNIEYLIHSYYFLFD